MKVRDFLSWRGARGLIQGPALFLLYLANFVFQFRLLSTVRGDQGPGVEALRRCPRCKDITANDVA